VVPTKEKVKHPAYWIPSTWFAMGLPFVALATASSILYKDLGIKDGEIAFWTSLIMMPWTVKPLWGPFLEMFKTKKFFVYTTQVLTGVLFGLAALSLYSNLYFALSIAIFFLVALSGATHDTAADGVYLDTLPANEQAKYVGWQGAFYNIAKIFSGGLLVFLAGKLADFTSITNAWAIVLLILAATMILLGIYNRRVLPSGSPSNKVESFQQGMATLKDVIITFFQKRNIWYGLLFIVFYRFAEGQAIKITPLFFKAPRGEGGLGLTTSEVGVLYGVFGAVAFVLGSIAAGYFVSKRGLSRKTLMILCAFFNIPFIAYAYLAIELPTNLYVIGSAVAIEYFGYGFGFVGLILFIMQQIAPGKYKMAHYAFGSGLMSLGFLVPSMVSGFVSDWLGYKDFFIWVLISTIPAFLISWLVPLKKPETEE
jgi:PAT family beta-lactamase induction signal transducer AmpG